MYLGEEVGICNEEDMIQDEINVMRFSMEEDTEPFVEVMHASIKTVSAVSIESQISMSAVQVQGQHDLDFLTRGDDVGKNMPLDSGQGSGDQNIPRAMEGENPEKAAYLEERKGQNRQKISGRNS